MNLVDMKVNEFLDVLASKSPAPGGGSVAALSGSNGAALVLMVGSLSNKKKKFRALSSEIQSEYNNSIEFFVNAKEEFTKLIDEDTLAFNEVMKAFKLPKETKSEQDIRKQTIEIATIGCIKTPMKVANLAKQCLKKISYLIEYSNRNTTSDLGVAILSFYTAFTGAIMNVKINLPGLSKISVVNEYKSVIMGMIIKVEELKDKLLEEINNLLE